MEPQLNKEIGSRVRTYRESKRMNRENFSEKVGLSPQFIAEVENGRKGLSAESLYKICSSCEISADYILMGKDNIFQTNSPLANLLNNISEDDSEKYFQIFQKLNDMVAIAKGDK